jgi:hypothetical protein
MSYAGQSLLHLLHRAEQVASHLLNDGALGFTRRDN